MSGQFWDRPAASGHAYRCRGCSKGFQREAALNDHEMTCPAVQQQRQQRNQSRISAAAAMPIRSSGSAAATRFAPSRRPIGTMQRPKVSGHMPIETCSNIPKARPSSESQPSASSSGAGGENGNCDTDLDIEMADEASSSNSVSSTHCSPHF